MFECGSVTSARFKCRMKLYILRLKSVLTSVLDSSAPISEVFCSLFHMMLAFYMADISEGEDLLSEKMRNNTKMLFQSEQQLKNP